MKVLIADDDRVIRRILEAALTEWGYGTVAVADGLSAWEALRAPDAPRFAILDWLMPGLDGLEVCRRVRELPTRLPPYLLLLTVRDTRPDIVAGLRGGADDYMTKPFDHNELHARLQTGLRILRLQEELAAELRRSQQALELVKQLQGLLPICGYCKRIRDDQDAWQQLEDYISAHSEARFSHGVCPRCWEEHVGPELRRMGAAGPENG
jgi:DNA-binding response OmpR family regulator